MKNIFSFAAIVTALSLMTVPSLHASTTMHGSVVGVDIEKQEVTLNVAEGNNITLKANSITQITVIHQEAVMALNWPARTFTYYSSDGDVLTHMYTGQLVHVNYL